MTDATAKAILGIVEVLDDGVDDGCVLIGCGVGTESIAAPLTDLKAMARLWLMRDEIVAQLLYLESKLPVGTWHGNATFIAKLRPLESPDENVPTESGAELEG